MAHTDRVGVDPFPRILAPTGYAPRHSFLEQATLELGQFGFDVELPKAWASAICGALLDSHGLGVAPRSQRYAQRFEVFVGDAYAAGHEGVRSGELALGDGVPSARIVELVWSAAGQGWERGQ